MQALKIPMMVYDHGVFELFERALTSRKLLADHRQRLTHIFSETMVESPLISVAPVGFHVGDCSFRAFRPHASGFPMGCLMNDLQTPPNAGPAVNQVTVVLPS